MGQLLTFDNHCISCKCLEGGPDPSVYRNKAVRDLAWLIRSPPLLSEDAGLALLREPGAPYSMEATTGWLHALDKNPAEFLACLRSQKSVSKMGFYAGALTEYWLRMGPGWDTKKTLTSVPLKTSSNGKNTAGQLKFVCLRADEALHVESSLKFFADIADPSKALGENDIRRFVGPSLQEDLSHRIAEAKRKVCSTQSASVKMYLQDELGNVPVRSAYFMKGYIFRRLEEFMDEQSLFVVPRELNPMCLQGWYTTNIDRVLEATGADAVFAIMPKLFWLSPVEAIGDPPILCGAPLPGQDSLVYAKPPEIIKLEVQQHFADFTYPILLCVLEPAQPYESGYWVERSRGFLLSPDWDSRPLECIPDEKEFADTDKGFSESIQGRRDLAEAEVLLTPKLGESLKVDHLVQYVFQFDTAAARCARKQLLRGALDESEIAEAGAACRLICSAVDAITRKGMRTQAHVLLELLPKPVLTSTLAKFQSDPDSLSLIFQDAFEGLLCPRLAMKFGFCFNTMPPVLSQDEMVNLLVGALDKRDRQSLSGFVELFAASTSLQKFFFFQKLDSIIELLSNAPAEATALECICSALPHRRELTVQSLKRSGQLRVARRIESCKWKETTLREFITPRQDSGDWASRSVVKSSSRELAIMCLPSCVHVEQVSDLQGLRAVIDRAKVGGVVGVDAEWKPWLRMSKEQNRYNPVQLLQLAWCEIVYLLDLPALNGCQETQDGLRQLFQVLLGSLRSLCCCDVLQTVVLVGFGLQFDMRCISDSYPFIFAAEDLKEWCGIDVVDFACSLPMNALFRSKQNTSLDQFCSEILGMRLDKTEQCSDWEQRPLSESQLRYAALDAWVLLPLLSLLMQLRSSTLGELPKGLTSDDLTRLVDASFDDACSYLAKFRSLSCHGSCAVADVLRQLEVVSPETLLIPRTTEENVVLVPCKTLACVLIPLDDTLTTSASDLCLAVLLDAHGENSLNLELLACALGQKSARLATSEELKSRFHQTKGCVGPIGPNTLVQPCPHIVLDHDVLTHARDDTRLACGAGASGWQLIISVDQLQALVGAVVARVSEPKDVSQNQRTFDRF